MPAVSVLGVVDRALADRHRVGDSVAHHLPAFGRWGGVGQPVLCLQLAHDRRGRDLRIGCRARVLDDLSRQARRAFARSCRRTRPDRDVEHAEQRRQADDQDHRRHEHLDQRESCLRRSRTASAAPEPAQICADSYKQQCEPHPARFRQTASAALAFPIGPKRISEDLRRRVSRPCAGGRPVRASCHFDAAGLEGGPPTIPVVPGDWCNGNMGVSKTLARGSIPRSPAGAMAC